MFQANARAHATLYIKLVDRTDPLRPVVLKRDGVRVTLDAGTPIRQEYWSVRGDQVRGGHQLADGDVIYVRTAHDEYWWLGEVTAVHGTPSHRTYDVHRLQAVERGDGSATNDDPRWWYPSRRPAVEEQLPLMLGRDDAQ